MRQGRSRKKREWIKCILLQVFASQSINHTTSIKFIVSNTQKITVYLLALFTHMDEECLRLAPIASRQIVSDGMGESHIESKTDKVQVFICHWSTGACETTPHFLFLFFFCIKKMMKVEKTNQHIQQSLSASQKVLLKYHHLKVEVPQTHIYYSH